MSAPTYDPARVASFVARLTDRDCAYVVALLLGGSLAPVQPLHATQVAFAAMSPWERANTIYAVRERLDRACLGLAKGAARAARVADDADDAAVAGGAA